jgi:putative nucleotidyltransferase with HDIG domain
MSMLVGSRAGVRPAGRTPAAAAAALSPLLSPYVALVIAAGGTLVAYSLYQLPGVPYPLGWIALAVLCIVGSVFPVQVPGVPVYISISDTFFITSALLFGPAPATVTIAADSLLASFRRRNNPRQVLFNSASGALALWCGAQMYLQLSAHVPMSLASESSPATAIAPLACLALVYFTLNSGLTAVVVSLSKGIPAFTLWRQHFAIISLSYVAAGSAAFFLVALLQSIGATAFAAVLPLIFICYVAMQSWLGRVDDAQRHVRKLNDLYMSTIGAFSTAIEAKDGVTSDHVHRVQAYALGLARALGHNDPETLQALEAASLLHDTGKLAVPEHILNKPGRLTPAEFETMKTHVDVGADILSSIDFPYPVVPIVRAHHENWDGTGYPRKLRGEEIPIGARILAVVDCFDALTSDRPYRPAMTEAQAIDIIVERRGTMYDPQVVDTFLAVYRDIAPAAEQQPALQSALRRIRKVQAEQASGCHRIAENASATDTSEELLAFVSLARVVSQTPTVRDIGTMAWGHLRQLAPGASLALFTVDATRGVLVAQCAAGPGADRLNGLTMNVAHRVSGWVAANWQPMLNADAHLDLEAPGDLRYMVSIPLVAEKRLVAVMSVYASEAFSELQTKRLEMIAPHFATALISADSGEPRQSTSRAQNSELRVVARR